MTQLEFFPREITQEKEHWRFRVLPNGIDLYREEGTVSIRLNENERGLLLKELEERWRKN